MRLYHDIHNYLGNLDVDGDILVNTRIYNNTEKNNNGGKKDIITLDKFDQSTFPTIPSKNNSTQ